MSQQISTCSSSTSNELGSSICRRQHVVNVSHHHHQQHQHQQQQQQQQYHAQSGGNSSTSGVCSYEMKTFRCHSVVDGRGVVTLCSSCRRADIRSSRLGGSAGNASSISHSSQSFGGRRSGSLVYSPASRRTFDRRRLPASTTLRCGSGTRRGGIDSSASGSMAISSTTASSSSSMSSPSSALYRVSSSSSGSGSGSVGSSLHSSDDSGYHGRKIGGGGAGGGGCGCCSSASNRNKGVVDGNNDDSIDETQICAGVKSHEKAEAAAAAASAQRRDEDRSDNKKTFGHLVLNYLELTSAHALPRVARSRSRLRRVMWIGTFVFFVGYFVYQFAALLSMFYSYPVGATIFIEQRRVIDFPAVTICNLNMMKASRLVNDPRYKNLSAMNRRFKNAVDDLVKKRAANHGKNPASVSSRSRKRNATGINPANNSGNSDIEAVRLESAAASRRNDRAPKRNNIDANVFSGVERKIAAMMKKVRRTRGNSDGDVGTQTTDALPIGVKKQNGTIRTRRQQTVEQPQNGGGPDAAANATHVNRETKRNAGQEGGDEDDDDDDDDESDEADDKERQSSKGEHPDDYDELYAHQVVTQENGSMFGHTVFQIQGVEDDGETPRRMGHGTSIGNETTSAYNNATQQPTTDDVAPGVNHLARGKKRGAYRVRTGSLDTPTDQTSASENFEYQESFASSTLHVVLSSGNIVFIQIFVILIINLIEHFEYQESGFSSVQNDYEFDELMAQSSSSDYSDLFQLLKPTSEDLESYGHQPDDFIVQCSFDTKNCSYRDFYRRVSPFFGNCFTFNHRLNGTPGQTTSKYGSRYGLRLTLNIEQAEYLGLFSHKAGVRVTVHPHNVTPFPEDLGLDAMPGSETEIGVTMETIKLVPSPHPSNCTARKNAGSGEDAGSESAYTILACNKFCIQRKLEQYCGCVDSEVTSVNATVMRCLSTNATQEKCRQLIRHSYDNNQQQCDCRPACQELVYKTSVSSATWPSEPYANLLASVLFENKTFTDTSDIYNSIRSNLVSVHVYMTDMNIRRIDEYPSYPWGRLLADIGGMLGLFIGISACTAVEFIEFVVDAILLAVAKCRLDVGRPSLRSARLGVSRSQRRARQLSP